MIPRAEERDFVRRMIEGDESAFDLFADTYVPALYRFAARRLAGDRELTGDIVQTTLCKAIASLPKFRGDAALMTWLCSCCLNEIAVHYRKKMRPVREVDLEVVEETSAAELGIAAPELPDSAALRNETRRLVHAALDELPPHYGQVLELKYLQDLPVNEIAARLELGPKAAESLLTRARVAFRKVHARLTATTQPPAEISRFQPHRMETAL
jgi:RNA polymerase sigma-70 factor (ECF subfamily)